MAISVIDHHPRKDRPELCQPFYLHKYLNINVLAQIQIYILNFVLKTCNLSIREILCLMYKLYVFIINSYYIFHVFLSFLMI